MSLHLLQMSAHVRETDDLVSERIIGVSRPKQPASLLIITMKKSQLKKDASVLKDNVVSFYDLSHQLEIVVTAFCDNNNE